MTSIKHCRMLYKATSTIWSKSYIFQKKVDETLKESFVEAMELEFEYRYYKKNLSIQSTYQT